MNSLELKEKRLKLGFSQKKLAKLVGVSTQTINGYENGKKIPLTKYQILEETLNREPRIFEIRTHRKRLGLTQEKLAKLIGVSTNTIINYESGGTVPDSKKDILDVIFKANDFDPDDYSEDYHGEIVYLPTSQYNKNLSKNELEKTSNEVLNQIVTYKKAIDSLLEIHKNILGHIELLEIIEEQVKNLKEMQKSEEDDRKTVN